MTDSKNKIFPMETLTSNINNKLKQNGTWDDVMARLGKCTNDVERMRVVLQCGEVLAEVSRQIRAHRRTVKSVETADKLRAQGNERFKAAKYDKALDCYTQAVLHAPFPTDADTGSSVLALSFGNRSAAFFHLKQFEHSLADIDNAIQYGFPAASRHKLLDRRAKCLLFLKRKQAAVEAFQEAREALLEDPTLEDKARQDLLRLTDNFIAKCQSLKEDGPPNKPGCVLHEPMPVLPDASSQMPCALNALEIKDVEGRGRGLYAKREIKIGEVLIVEKPYCSVVISDYAVSHCHECCARCFVPLPCQDCVDVVFCSAQCRKAAADNNHGSECGLLPLFHETDVKLGHLAYRMVLKAGYRYLVEQRQVLENPRNTGPMLGCDDKGVYDSANYATGYHLVGHSEQRAVDDLWIRTIKAAFLVKCLETTDFFPEMQKCGDGGDGLVEDQRFDDVCYVASHMMRHLMMLPCNAHEVSEMGTNWPEPSQSETLEIGSGIYPVLSLINHSCDPNVVRHSYDNTCVVRAVRGIPAGEELLDNYGALYPVMERAARQTHLQQQYYFTCACQPCVLNWPMYMEIPKEVMHFYCQNCNGRVPVPDVMQADRAENMACLDCGHRQNIRKVILKVGGLEAGYQAALHKVIFKLEVTADTLSTLVHFLRVVDKNVHRPFGFHNDCQEAIKMCYAFKANAYPRKP